MLADLRQAFRLLARSRGFTIASILILALGIGANTAVFTIVRAVLLRPLPYHEPDRLIYLWYGTDTARGNRHGILTGDHVTQYSLRNTTLASYAILKTWQSTLEGQVDLLREPETERLRGTFATANLFELLGVHAAVGRTFTPSDDNGPPTVVLSDAAIVSRSTSEERFYALTTGAFASIAVLLAVTGLFGVVSRSVSERRREIAIRVALGADARSLFRLIFAYGLTPVIFGMLAGLWGAVSASRLAAALPVRGGAHRSADARDRGVVACRRRRRRVLSASASGDCRGADGCAQE